MKKICSNCGIEFNAKHSVQKYCSYECSCIDRRVDWGKILEYYDRNCESGKTYLEMAKDFGISVSTFRKVCVENGRTKPLTKRQVIIKELFDNGNSIKEISVKTNNSKKNVILCLKAIGVYKVYSELETRSCLRCQKEFTVPKYSNKKFCSDYCQKVDGHQRNDIIRKRLKNKSIVDSDITLIKLFERDNGICKICGSVCDWNDFKFVNGKKHSSRMYPTIDHITPLKKGGVHSWDNVQLAHLSCNSSKGAS